MVDKVVRECFLKAEKDLDEAKFLFENRRPLEDVAYFVHQSIEKHLKGFLISKGWEMEKIHDLVRLIRVGGIILFRRSPGEKGTRPLCWGMEKSM